jgi:hypothetical protein
MRDRVIERQRDAERGEVLPGAIRCLERRDAR